MISRVNVARGTWVFVEGAEDGGFRIRISHNGQDFTYQENIVFEQAVALSLEAQNMLGLPDENVLVNISDVAKTPDRSRGIDAVKKLAQQAGV